MSFWYASEVSPDMTFSLLIMICIQTPLLLAPAEWAQSHLKHISALFIIGLNMAVAVNVPLLQSYKRKVFSVCYSKLVSLPNIHGAQFYINSVKSYNTN